MEKLLQQSITIRSEEQLGFLEHESPQEIASDKVLVLKSSVKSGKVLSKGEQKSPTKKPRIKASVMKGHKNTIVKKKSETCNEEKTENISFEEDKCYIFR